MEKTRAFLAPVYEMALQIPGIRMLWGRQDYNDLRLSAMESFLQCLPPEFIQSKNVQEHRYVLQQANGPGGQVFFKGLKDIAGLGSQEFAVIVVTEAHEISHNAYLTLKQRCRQKCGPCIILLESNPPNKGHWIDNLTKKDKTEYDPNVTRMRVSTRENQPNLPKAYFNDLAALPKPWRNKYMEGFTGFTPEGTPVYGDYEADRHGERDLGWYKSRDILCGWDFGFEYPAVVFTQIDPDGRWLILREIQGNKMTINDFGDLFIEKRNQWFPNCRCQHYGDPSGNSVSDKSDPDGDTTIEILETKKIYVQTKGSTYKQRMEIITKKIQKSRKGKPMILVDKRCQNSFDPSGLKDMIPPAYWISLVPIPTWPGCTIFPP